MSTHEFCPECGIGISNQEIAAGFCLNCRTDIKVQLEEEKLFWNEPDEPEEESDF